MKKNEKSGLHGAPKFSTSPRDLTDQMSATATLLLNLILMVSNRHDSFVELEEEESMVEAMEDAAGIAA